MKVKYQGLVFYYGHALRPLPNEILTEDTKWIYIHKNSKAKPDIVGDLADPRFLLSLGLAQYDKVIIWYELEHTMYFARALLKPGGLLYFNNYISCMATEYLNRQKLPQYELVDISIRNAIISRKDKDPFSILKESVIWNLIEEDLLEKQLVYHDIQIMNFRPRYVGVVSVFQNMFVHKIMDDLNDYKGLILKSDYMDRLDTFISRDEWLLCPVNIYCVKVDELQSYGFNNNEKLIVQVCQDTHLKRTERRVKACLSVAKILLKSGGQIHMVNVILAAINKYSWTNIETYPIELIDVTRYKETLQILEKEMQELKSVHRKFEEKVNKLTDLYNEKISFRDIRNVNYQNIVNDVKERYLKKDEIIVKAINDIIIELLEGTNFSIDGQYDNDPFSLTLTKN